MDARKYAPATARNREPIVKVLLQFLPPRGNILEIASGTGEHAIFFAPRLFPRVWIPSDPQPFLRDSIQAWEDFSPAENLYPPLDIDVEEEIWEIEGEKIAIASAPFSFLLDKRCCKQIAAIVNINMIHIAPWSACLGLMAGAGRLLKKGGILYLYGPYKQGGKHTVPSNLAFDESLRSQNPQWGVRDLELVVAAANKQGLELIETVPMPANNLSVIFQRD